MQDRLTTKIVPPDEDGEVLTPGQYDQYMSLNDVLEPMLADLDELGVLVSSEASEPGGLEPISPTLYHAGGPDGITFTLRLKFQTPVSGLVVREAVFEAGLLLAETNPEEPSTSHDLYLRRY